MLNAKSYLHKVFKIRKKQIFCFLLVVLCSHLAPVSVQAGVWSAFKSTISNAWEDAKYSSDFGVETHFNNLVSKNQYQFNEEEKNNINRALGITNTSSKGSYNTSTLIKQGLDGVSGTAAKAVVAGAWSYIKGGWTRGLAAMTTGNVDQANQLIDTTKEQKNYERMTNALAEAIARSDIGQAYGAMLKKGVELQNSESDAELATREEIKKLLMIYANDATTEEGLAKAIKDVQKNLYDRTTDMLKTYDKAKENQMNDEDALAAATQAEVKATEIKKCVPVSELKLKYQSGCYSCFIVGNLISTFLDVAGKVYPTSQKAGLIVLLIGTLIWLAMWGLKNVSSLTQIDGGNILNDLIKFSFKVMLAYLFITAGVSFVGKYIINPIMGTGAVIAQQFWDERFKEDVVDYVWDDVEVVEDLQTVVQEANKENKEEIKKNQETNLVTTPEQQTLLNEAKKLELQESQKSDIPAFITPGVTGRITSYPGCRPRPKTANGYGSASHMGLDIGGNNMVPIKAIASGTISYSGSASSGWGLKAIITTKHKGNTWTHLYGHMNPATYNSIKSKLNGREVVRGQQIGNVGTTGNSSGPHLHLEVQLNGKVGEYTYKNVYLDPISLGQGSIVPRAFAYNEKTKTFTDNRSRCDGKNRDPAPPTGYARGAQLPADGFSSSGKAGLDLSATYVSSGDGSAFSDDFGDAPSIIEVPQFEYKATAAAKAIMSESVIKSILGATKVITSTLAENMVLGNALTCYATLDKGGAWHIGTEILGISFNFGFITNWFLWIEGAIIWVSGFLLTMAVAYYLLDVCFKIGFAVIALPIVVGLWPFEMTKKKFSSCISIIAKSAATFAFLAMTASYGIKLISSVLSGGEDAMGLEKIYQAIDAASSGTGERGDENVQYVMSHMDLFSINFVLLMFAIIYTFKLVGATVQKLVSKFFPDNFFGEQQPMHHNLTAVTKAAKDLAMKPVGMARDIAMHQTGKLAVGAVKAAAHPVRTAKTVGNSVKKGLNKAKGIFK